MKVSIWIFLVSFFFSIGAHAQNDSLQLNFSYELSNDMKYNVRVDFISHKLTPILFQEKPIYLIQCGFDDIKLESEVLNGNCFEKIEQSECIPRSQALEKVDLKVLHYRDTNILRYNIKLLDKEALQKTRNIRANYRFRISRIYLENGMRRQIFSNWIFVSYP